MEVWKDINGYKGLYQISNKARIRSIDRYVNNIKGRALRKGKVLKQSIHINGYYKITLSKCSKLKTYRLHRLVALHFIPTSSTKLVVNHKDGNKLNNSLSNLEWCTRSEDSQHALRLGLQTSGKTDKRSKSVSRFKLDGTFIDSFDSINLASKLTKIAAGNISSCCNNLSSHAKQYIWKFN